MCNVYLFNTRTQGQNIFVAVIPAGLPKIKIAVAQQKFEKTKN